MRTLTTLGLGALLATALVSTPAAAVANGSVRVVDFAFQPATLTLTLDLLNGNKVTFRNDGFFSHQPHSDMHATPGEAACFGTGVLVHNAQATVTVNPACALALGAAGIPYHCHIHPFMVGRVIVLPA